MFTITELDSTTVPSCDYRGQFNESVLMFIIRNMKWHKTPININNNIFINHLCMNGTTL